MSYVFISYSTRDSEYAAKLEENLRRRGFDTWIADKSIFSGEKWWDVIVSALLQCDAIIVLMTPASDASDWVQKEIHIGQKHSKPFFPLLLEGTDNTPHWLFFSNVQITSVAGEQLPKSEFFESLATKVQRQKGRGRNVTHKLPFPSQFSRFPEYQQPPQMSKETQKQAVKAPPTDAQITAARIGMAGALLGVLAALITVLAAIIPLFDSPRDSDDNPIPSSTSSATPTPNAPDTIMQASTDAAATPPRSPTPTPTPTIAFSPTFTPTLTATITLSPTAAAHPCHTSGSQTIAPAGLPPFTIDTAPVTAGQYACMTSGTPSNDTGTQLNVSADAAAAYCRAMGGALASLDQWRAAADAGVQPTGREWTSTPGTNGTIAVHWQDTLMTQDIAAGAPFASVIGFRCVR